MSLEPGVLLEQWGPDVWDVSAEPANLPFLSPHTAFSWPLPGTWWARVGLRALLFLLGSPILHFGFLHPVHLLM